MVCRYDYATARGLPDPVIHAVCSSTECDKIYPRKSTGRPLLSPLLLLAVTGSVLAGMDYEQMQAEMPEVSRLAGAGQGFETFGAAVAARREIEAAMRKRGALTLGNPNAHRCAQVCPVPDAYPLLML